MTAYAYKPRTEESYEKNSRDNRGSIVKAGTNFYKPKEGKNIIRILPPTWENSEHFGLPVYIHYRIGINNETFLCLRNDLPGRDSEQCPICDGLEHYTDIDPEYKKTHSAKRRIAVYVLDRDDTSKGPKIWFMPPSLNKDICLRSKSSFTGTRYHIDNPEGSGSSAEGGRDIAFEYVRQGKNGFPEYLAVTMADTSTPLGDPAWLEKVVKNSIPSILLFVENEKVAKAFGAHNSSGESANVTETKEEEAIQQITEKVVETPALETSNEGGALSKLDQLRSEYNQ